MSSFRFIQPALPRRMVLGAGCGVIALLTLAGFGLVAAAQNQRDEIADLNATIARAEAAGPTTTTGLPDSAFYTGDTPQLAQAVLQSNLQSLAQAHSINIEVMRADQIDQIDGFVRLNMTLNGVAPETELGAFLHGLAVLEPIVVINEISLRRARQMRRNTERRVSFQLQLYGLSQR
ncbi:type II secretion system (T2SS) protein M subtype b [Yoonia maricola]|uniref:Type II secretion system (T2SS) protein M subtype b n=1 Tax=Yoonia maricola TaxID=420999 RepID=A0A2M8W1X0_9RHOB|nr:GspMb/PilO family protein [Yoonia maricola]PJI84917.1 type II secretion system (T2SS) protein M subtype b [Yoonia maricola]